MLKKRKAAAAAAVRTDGSDVSNETSQAASHIETELTERVAETGCSCSELRNYFSNLPA